MTYKWGVVVAIALFIIGIIAGTVTPSDALLAHDLSASLKELARVLSPFSPVTALIIFIKNVIAMLLSFILSPLLCLMPVLTLLVNGWLLGFVAEAVIQQKSLGYMLAGVLPHGIFEIPAMIIAQAAALGFGTALILALFQKKRRAALVPRLSLYVKFLVLAIILLLPAAIIETFVTPLILGR